MMGAMMTYNVLLYSFIGFVIVIHLWLPHDDAVAAVRPCETIGMKSSPIGVNLFRCKQWEALGRNDIVDFDR